MADQRRGHDRFYCWTDEKRLGTPAEGSVRTAMKNLPPYRDRVNFIKDGKDMPWPGLGQLAKRGDGFRYVPMPMQLVL